MSANAVELSIVTSLYRSAPFVEEFCARAAAAARRVTQSFEIILVNDGSPDDALNIALNLCAAEPHIRVIDLSRNFGHHRALMTGLARARGERVFLLDSDLEEDPALLLAFDDAMRATGADVIYGVQASRKGGWLERVTGDVFFSVFNRLLSTPIPKNVVTARLMTARYVRALLLHQEREICLAGLWVTTGFDQRPFQIQKGSRNDSTYSLRMRLSAFANAITSFSNRPLVYIFQIGVAVMLLSVVAGGVLFYKSLTGSIGVPGWASIMVSVWFLGGLIIFCVGVIGMYLAKIFTEIKQRPYSIVRAEYGLDQASETDREGSAA